ncbi:WxcM-like domain-containing protein [Sphingobacterium sp.]|uniref:WxcM-like domain-containing protein n=1 Tax=Sphingobacterium sp. TaxID=341027 RepID=UPI00289D3137|nr:WxcM-like domain-containing protein [Sphingobacterium sp.]
MVRFIEGGIAKDTRGEIRFVNDFDLTEVKRFYIIKNSDTHTIRGWRAHRNGQRWFYVLSGAFSLDVVKIGDWENIDREVSIQNYSLYQADQQMLHLPIGYATAIRAIEADSELLVYADQSLSESLQDDYTFGLDYFVNKI